MLLIKRGDSIVKMQEVMEGVGPKFDVKIGAGMEAAKTIGKSEVTAFHRSVLVGGISAGGVDIVAQLFK